MHPEGILSKYTVLDCNIEGFSSLALVKLLELTEVVGCMGLIGRTGFIGVLVWARPPSAFLGDDHDPEFREAALARLCRCFSRGFLFDASCGHAYKGYEEPKIYRYHGTENEPYANVKRECNPKISICGLSRKLPLGSF